jgi:hypothetical protein
MEGAMCLLLLEDLRDLPSQINAGTWETMHGRSYISGWCYLFSLQKMPSRTVVHDLATFVLFISNFFGLQVVLPAISSSLISRVEISTHFFFTGKLLQRSGLSG